MFSAKPVTGRGATMRQRLRKAMALWQPPLAALNVIRSPIARTLTSRHTGRELNIDFQAAGLSKASNLWHTVTGNLKLPSYADRSVKAAASDAAPRGRLR